MNIDWLTPVCWLNPKAAGLTMNKWEGDCTRLLLIFLKKNLRLLHVELSTYQCNVPLQAYIQVLVLVLVLCA